MLECQTTIEQLDFPVVDHDPYVSERFRPYLTRAAARAIHGDRLHEEGLPVVARKVRPPSLAPHEPEVTRPFPPQMPSLA